VLAVGFVANLLIRPVDEKHFDVGAVRESSTDRETSELTSGSRA